LPPFDPAFLKIFSFEILLKKSGRLTVLSSKPGIESYPFGFIKELQCLDDKQINRRESLLPGRWSSLKGGAIGMKALFPLLIYLVLMMVFLALSIKVVREDHRLVIFRLGRFFGVKGPGLAIRIPVVDRIQDVNLTESLPGWQGLSKPELDERVKSLVLYRPQGPG